MHQADRQVNGSGSPQFHLRRIGPQATKPNVADVMDFQATITMIGRNSRHATYIIDSSNLVQSHIISRNHARLVRQNNNEHRLFDDSLNGIFVNNVKIRGSVVLSEGDAVTFGHACGAKMAVGTWIRQPDSEYQFIFESCYCSTETPAHQGTDFRCPDAVSSKTVISQRRRHIHTATVTMPVEELRRNHNTESNIALNRPSLTEIIPHLNTDSAISHISHNEVADNANGPDKAALRAIRSDELSEVTPVMCSSEEKSDAGVCSDLPISSTTSIFNQVLDEILSVNVTEPILSTVVCDDENQNHVIQSLVESVNRCTPPCEHNIARIIEICADKTVSTDEDGSGFDSGVDDDPNNTMDDSSRNVHETKVCANDASDVQLKLSAETVDSCSILMSSKNCHEVAKVVIISEQFDNKNVNEMMAESISVGTSELANSILVSQQKAIEMPDHVLFGGNPRFVQQEATCNEALDHVLCNEKPGFPQQGDLEAQDNVLCEQKPRFTPQANPESVDHELFDENPVFAKQENPKIRNHVVIEEKPGFLQQETKCTEAPDYGLYMEDPRIAHLGDPEVPYAFCEEKSGIAHQDDPVAPDHIVCEENLEIVQQEDSEPTDPVLWEEHPAMAQQEDPEATDHVVCEEKPGIAQQEDPEATDHVVCEEKPGIAQQDDPKATDHVVCEDAAMVQQENAEAPDHVLYEEKSRLIQEENLCTEEPEFGQHEDTEAVDPLLREENPGIGQREDRDALDHVLCDENTGFAKQENPEAPDHVLCDENAEFMQQENPEALHYVLVCEQSPEFPQQEDSKVQDNVLCKETSGLAQQEDAEYVDHGLCEENPVFATQENPRTPDHVLIEEKPEFLKQETMCTEAPDHGLYTENPETDQQENPDALDHVCMENSGMAQQEVTNTCTEAPDNVLSEKNPGIAREEGPEAPGHGLCNENVGFMQQEGCGSLDHVLYEENGVLTQQEDPEAPDHVLCEENPAMAQQEDPETTDHVVCEEKPAMAQQDDPKATVHVVCEEKPAMAQQDDPEATDHVVCEENPAMAQQDDPEPGISLQDDPKATGQVVCEEMAAMAQQDDPKATDHVVCEDAAMVQQENAEAPDHVLYEEKSRLIQEENLCTEEPEFGQHEDTEAVDPLLREENPGIGQREDPDALDHVLCDENTGFAKQENPEAPDHVLCDENAEFMQQENPEALHYILVCEESPEFPQQVDSKVQDNVLCKETSGLAQQEDAEYVDHGLCEENPVFATQENPKAPDHVLIEEKPEFLKQESMCTEAPDHGLYTENPETDQQEDPEALDYVLCEEDPGIAHQENPDALDHVLCENPGIAHQENPDALDHVLCENPEFAQQENPESQDHIVCMENSGMAQQEVTNTCTEAPDNVLSEKNPGIAREEGPEAPGHGLCNENVGFMQQEGCGSLDHVLYEENGVLTQQEDLEAPDHVLSEENPAMAQQEDPETTDHVVCEEKPAMAQQDDPKATVHVVCEEKPAMAQQDDPEAPDHVVCEENPAMAQQDDPEPGISLQDDPKATGQVVCEEKPAMAQQDDPKATVHVVCEEKPAMAQQDDPEATDHVVCEKNPAMAQQDDPEPGISQQDDPEATCHVVCDEKAGLLQDEPSCTEASDHGLYTENPGFGQQEAPESPDHVLFEDSAMAQQENAEAPDNVLCEDYSGIGQQEDPDALDHVLCDENLEITQQDTSEALDNGHVLCEEHPEFPQREDSKAPDNVLCKQTSGLTQQTDPELANHIVYEENPANAQEDPELPDHVLCVENPGFAQQEDPEALNHVLCEENSEVLCEENTGIAQQEVFEAPDHGLFEENPELSQQEATCTEAPDHILCEGTPGIVQQEDPEAPDHVLSDENPRMAQQKDPEIPDHVLGKENPRIGQQEATCRETPDHVLCEETPGIVQQETPEAPDHVFCKENSGIGRQNDSNAPDHVLCDENVILQQEGPEVTDHVLYEDNPEIHQQENPKAPDHILCVENTTISQQEDPETKDHVLCDPQPGFAHQEGPKASDHVLYSENPLITEQEDHEAPDYGLCDDNTEFHQQDDHGLCEENTAITHQASSEASDDVLLEKKSALSQEDMTGCKERQDDASLEDEEEHFNLFLSLESCVDHSQVNDPDSEGHESDESEEPAEIYNKILNIAPFVQVNLPDDQDNCEIDRVAIKVAEDASSRGVIQHDNCFKINAKEEQQCTEEASSGIAKEKVADHRGNNDNGHMVTETENCNISIQADMSSSQSSSSEEESDGSNEGEYTVSDDDRNDDYSDYELSQSEQDLSFDPMANFEIDGIKPLLNSEDENEVSNSICIKRFTPTKISTPNILLKNDAYRNYDLPIDISVDAFSLDERKKSSNANSDLSFTDSDTESSLALVKTTVSKVITSIDKLDSEENKLPSNKDRYIDESDDDTSKNSLDDCGEDDDDGIEIINSQETASEIENNCIILNKSGNDLKGTLNHFAMSRSPEYSLVHGAESLSSLTHCKLSDADVSNDLDGVSDTDGIAETTSDSAQEEISDMIACLEKSLNEARCEEESSKIEKQQAGPDVDSTKSVISSADRIQFTECDYKADAVQCDEKNQSIERDTDQEHAIGSDTHEQSVQYNAGTVNGIADNIEKIRSVEYNSAQNPFADWITDGVSSHECNSEPRHLLDGCIDNIDSTHMAKSLGEKQSVECGSDQFMYTEHCADSVPSPVHDISEQVYKLQPDIGCTNQTHLSEITANIAKSDVNRSEQIQAAELILERDKSYGSGSKEVQFARCVLRHESSAECNKNEEDIANYAAYPERSILYCSDQARLTECHNDQVQPEGGISETVQSGGCSGDNAPVCSPDRAQSTECNIDQVLGDVCNGEPVQPIECITDKKLIKHCAVTERISESVTNQQFSEGLVHQSESFNCTSDQVHDVGYTTNQTEQRCSDKMPAEAETCDDGNQSTICTESTKNISHSSPIVISINSHEMNQQESIKRKRNHKLLDNIECNGGNSGDDGKAKHTRFSEGSSSDSNYDEDCNKLYHHAATQYHLQSELTLNSAEKSCSESVKRLTVQFPADDGIQTIRKKRIRNFVYQFFLAEEQRKIEELMKRAVFEVFCGGEALISQAGIDNAGQKCDSRARGKCSSSKDEPLQNEQINENLKTKHLVEAGSLIQYDMSNLTSTSALNHDLNICQSETNKDTSVQDNSPTEKRSDEPKAFAGNDEYFNSQEEGTRAERLRVNNALCHSTPLSGRGVKHKKRKRGDQSESSDTDGSDVQKQHCAEVAPSEDEFQNNITHKSKSVNGSPSGSSSCVDNSMFEENSDDEDNVLILSGFLNDHPVSFCDADMDRTETYSGTSDDDADDCLQEMESMCSPIITSQCFTDNEADDDNPLDNPEVGLSMDVNTHCIDYGTIDIVSIQSKVPDLNQVYDLPVMLNENTNSFNAITDDPDLQVIETDEQIAVIEGGNNFLNISDKSKQENNDKSNDKQCDRECIIDFCLTYENDENSTGFGELEKDWNEKIEKHQAIENCRINIAGEKSANIQPVPESEENIKDCAIVPDSCGINDRDHADLSLTLELQAVVDEKKVDTIQTLLDTQKNLVITPDLTEFECDEIDQIDATRSLDKMEHKERDALDITPELAQVGCDDNGVKHLIMRHDLAYGEGKSRDGSQNMREGDNFLITADMDELECDVKAENLDVMQQLSVSKHEDEMLDITPDLDDLAHEQDKLSVMPDLSCIGNNVQNVNIATHVGNVEDIGDDNLDDMPIFSPCRDEACESLDTSTHINAIEANNLYVTAVKNENDNKTDTSTATSVTGDEDLSRNIRASVDDDLDITPALASLSDDENDVDMYEDEGLDDKVVDEDEDDKLDVTPDLASLSDTEHGDGHVAIASDFTSVSHKHKDDNLDVTSDLDNNDEKLELRSYLDKLVNEKEDENLNFTPHLTTFRDIEYKGTAQNLSEYEDDIIQTREMKQEDLTVSPHSPSTCTLNHKDSDSMPSSEVDIFEQNDIPENSRNNNLCESGNECSNGDSSHSGQYMMQSQASQESQASQQSNQQSSQCTPRKLSKLSLRKNKYKILSDVFSSPDIDSNPIICPSDMNCNSVTEIGSRSTSALRINLFETEQSVGAAEASEISSNVSETFKSLIPYSGSSDTESMDTDVDCARDGEASSDDDSLPDMSQVLNTRAERDNITDCKEILKLHTGSRRKRQVMSIELLNSDESESEQLQVCSKKQKTSPPSLNKTQDHDIPEFESVVMGSPLPDKQIDMSLADEMASLQDAYFPNTQIVKTFSDHQLAEAIKSCENYLSHIPSSSSDEQNHTDDFTEMKFPSFPISIKKSEIFEQHKDIPQVPTISSSENKTVAQETKPKCNVDQNMKSRCSATRSRADSVLPADEKPLKPDRRKAFLDKLLKRRNQIKCEVKTEMSGGWQASRPVDDSVGNVLPSAPNEAVQCVQTQIQKCSSLLNTISQNLTNPTVQHIPRINTWRAEIVELMKCVKTGPDTIIAVVGDTGSGKSCLLNALLDHSSVLPTSGIRACTAVVVEISNNTQNNFYEADIEFLSRKEWFHELQILLTDMTGPDGRVRKTQPDPKSERGVSYSKIKAVYGKVDTLEALQSMGYNITKWLGRTRLIQETRPKELKHKIEDYIESSDTGKGGQLWPIVRQVRVRIPNCAVCSSGAKLVDLPGIRDSNAARDQIAKQYLKNCTAVWVVASIHRAIDDKTAKDLLGETFRRQLLMDGQYGSVSFICTKTDVLIPSEIIRQLDLHSKCSVMEKELIDAEWIHKIKQADLDTLNAELSALDDELAEVHRECMELRNLITEAETLLAPSEDSEESAGDSEELAQMDELEKELTDKEACDLELEDSVHDKKVDVRDKEKEIVEIDQTITAIHKSLAALCSKERNTYSRKQIRRDFKAGLQEMKRKAGLPDQDDDIDDDAMNESLFQDDHEQIGSTADNAKVFCVSAAEFLKMRHLMPNDGPPQVFSNVADTEIPALCEHVHHMTSVRHEKHVRTSIQAIGCLFGDMNNYVLHGRSKDKAVRVNARAVIDSEVQKLESKFEITLGSLSHEISDSFNLHLYPTLADGVTKAMQAAQETSDKWAAPVSKENKHAGGLHWNTYKAVCRRGGAFKSRAYGVVDFNEQLSEPVFTCVSIGWDTVFSATLWKVVDKFCSKIMSLLNVFSKSTLEELVKLGINLDSIKRADSQVVLSTRNKLKESVTRLKELITKQQRDISRLVVPAIKTCMNTTYETCTGQCGSGIMNKLKQSMAVGIETKKPSMFCDASHQVNEELSQIQTTILLHLQNTCAQLCQDLRAIYEPLWEAPSNSQILKLALGEGVTAALSQIHDLYRSVGIPIPVPQRELSPPTPTSRLMLTSDYNLSRMNATFPNPDSATVSDGDKSKHGPPDQDQVSDVVSGVRLSSDAFELDGAGNRSQIYVKKEPVPSMDTCTAEESFTYIVTKRVKQERQSQEEMPKSTPQESNVTKTTSSLLFKQSSSSSVSQVAGCSQSAANVNESSQNSCSHSTTTSQLFSQSRLRIPFTETQVNNAGCHNCGQVRGHSPCKSCSKQRSKSRKHKKFSSAFPMDRSGISECGGQAVPSSDPSFILACVSSHPASHVPCTKDICNNTDSDKTVLRIKSEPQGQGYQNKNHPTRKRPRHYGGVIDLTESSDDEVPQPSKTVRRMVSSKHKS